MRFVIRKDTQVNNEENWDYLMNEVTPKQSDVRKLFLNATNEMINNMQESNINNIEKNIPYEKFKYNMEKLGLYLIAVYLFGANNGKKKTPGVLGKTDFSLNVQDDATQKFIGKQVDKIIDGITEESKNAVNEIVKRSKKGIENLTPDMELQRIKNVIGLNTKQALAVDNYFLSLLSKGTKIDAALRMAKEYSNKLLNDRGNTIAQTELMRALNKGYVDFVNTAIKEGIIKEDDYLKEWWTSRDERVCKYCGPLHGVRVKPNESFDTGLGDVMESPLHTNCRCTILFVPNKERG